MARVSAKYALTDHEQLAVRTLLASGKRRYVFAWRHALCVPRISDGEFVERTERVDSIDPKELPAYLETLPALRGAEMQRRAHEFFAQQHIQQYIEELESPPVDLARQVMVEQTMFGTEKDARASAAHILADQEKVGIRDAFDRWAELLCQVGAEIVLDLPHELRKDVRCTACGAANHVVIPLELSAPFEEMFGRREAEDEADA